MIDISLHHAYMEVSSFNDELLEYKGYDKEYYALDFTDKNQAQYAIRKWIIPNTRVDFPATGKYQIKEACRYCLTTVRPWGDVWLPGIEGDASFKKYSMEHWQREMQKFYLLLWQELYPDDPYKPANLSQYRQRVDENFVNFPHMPETWGTPEYKSWS